MTGNGSRADHKPSDARYQCDLRSDDGGCIGHGRILCKYRRYGSRFFSGKQPVYQYGTYICDDAVSCHYDVSYKLCMCETNRGSFADRQLDTGWKVSDGNRPVRGTVEFRHVTFAYPGADEPILKDISFESRSGEVTAIIGRNGTGKIKYIKN